MSPARWVEPLAPGARRPGRRLRLETDDGVGLRAALWTGAGRGRGLALFLPGRAEFLEKAAITATLLAERGFAVASLDWRGQGLSDRWAVPRAKGHVGDFAEYDRDLAALLAAPEVAAEGPPRLVVGHSMGGALAAQATAEGRLHAPLVLSAPMFGIRVAPIERRIARLLAHLAERGGRGDLWPPVPKAARPYPLSVPFEGNLLSGARDVWDWLGGILRAEPALGTGLPTLGWLLAAERAMRRLLRLGALGVPALQIIGSGERVVSAQAMAAAAARHGIATVTLPGARHEPLIESPELRARAWTAVDAFLADSGV